MLKEQLSAIDKISLSVGKGMNSNLIINANMHLILRNQYGIIKEERFIKNTVTTAGKNGVADQILASPTLVTMGWMAVGSGSPAPTLLGAEPGTLTGTTRVAFTSKLRNNAVITVVGDFPAASGTGAITEAGTFNVVTSNTVDMWMSASFAVVNKLAADSLSISWTLTIS